MSNPERINISPEREQKDSGALELHEKLRGQLERNAETSPERVENAQHEALEVAKSIEVEQQAAEQHDHQPSRAERRGKGPISKAERELSFKTTMTEVQSQMSVPSRVFSKVIHNKTVEKVSEVTGNTIARPNAVLSGAVFAFTLTLAVYLVAKNLGYPLSGFETIGAFVAGWVIGLVYDFLKVMITGRK